MPILAFCSQYGSDVLKGFRHWKILSEQWATGEFWTSVTLVPRCHSATVQQDRCIDKCLIRHPLVCGIGGWRCCFANTVFERTNLCSACEWFAKMPNDSDLWKLLAFISCGSQSCSWLCSQRRIFQGTIGDLSLCARTIQVLAILTVSFLESPHHQMSSRHRCSPQRWGKVCWKYMDMDQVLQHLYVEIPERIHKPWQVIRWSNWKCRPSGLTHIMHIFMVLNKTERVGKRKSGLTWNVRAISGDRTMYNPWKKKRVPNQELQLNVLECLSPKKTWYTTFLMKFL